MEVLTLIKGSQKFVWIFPLTIEGRDDTLKGIAAFAANPELDFSWHDAALLSRKVREHFEGLEVVLDV